MDKLQVVYVLVSQEEDFYLEELTLSIISLRNKNENVSVVVLMDNITYDSIINSQTRCEILKLIDEVIVEEYPDTMTMRVRSRYLKTTLRKLIKGDFLFIDCDTLIADSLNDIKLIESDISMVLDNHVEFSNKNDVYSIEICMEKVGFGKENILDKYYNSGVIFCKDTELAHEFFDIWHQNYKKCVENKFYQDQQSLNYTNYLFNNCIYELNGVWNCQLDRGVRFLSEAKILHYLGFQYTSWNGSNSFLMHKISDVEIFKRIKKTGTISIDVMEIVNHPREQVKDCVTIPIDSPVYSIITSNVFLLLQIIYIKFNKVFNVFNSIITKLYRLYSKIKNSTLLQRGSKYGRS